MRIGMITTSFPNAADAVSGRFVFEMAGALANRGHTVEVITPASDACTDRHPPHHGVSAHYVRYAPREWRKTFHGAGVPDNVQMSRRAWPGAVLGPAGLLAAVRSHRSGWDVMVSHWALPCGLIAGVMRECRPHLMVLHSADVALLARLPGRRAIARRLLHGATHLRFVAEALRERFAACLDGEQRPELWRRSSVRPMGFTSASPIARTMRVDDERIVLAMSRLVPIKGLDVAIEALRGVPRVMLIVAGQGPERARLEARARSCGVNARFVGHVEGAAKAELLAQADVFVLPSVELSSNRTEGAPVALLEAMGAGCCVVASDTGGVPERVKDGLTGLLARPGDVGELRERLELALGDAPLRQRLGTEAAKLVDALRWELQSGELEQHLSGTP